MVLASTMLLVRLNQVLAISFSFSLLLLLARSRLHITFCPRCVGGLGVTGRAKSPDYDYMSKITPNAPESQLRRELERQKGLVDLAEENAQNLREELEKVKEQAKERRNKDANRCAFQGWVGRKLN